MHSILVVDDDPHTHIGLALRAWLKRHGFRVSIADGGRNALAALGHSTTKYSASRGQHATCTRR